MTAYSRQFLLVLGTALVIAVFLYLLIHISEAKLQLLVTVAAVGGGCYAIGLNQDSRFSQSRIDALELEKRALEEKVRALKEMYLEDRAAVRTVEPPPAHSSHDTITIRGGPIRDLFGKLMRGPTPFGPIATSLPSRASESFENGSKTAREAS